MRLNLDVKNKILGDRYYLHCLIAQSDHSKIFLATDLAIGDRKCAVKQMYPSYFPVEARSKIESAFLNEVEILKRLSLRHPQIGQYYNYFVDSGKQYLVQEWVEGDSLEEKLRHNFKFSESKVRDIILNTLLTIEYVHRQGIVHNDIKPGNLILRLQDQLPVLIDFGIARKIDCIYKHSIVGTPGYMSLEQAMGKVSFNNDLYSLGVTAIELLTGKSPLSVDFNSNKNNFWEQEKTAFDPKFVEIIDRSISSQDNLKFTSATEMLAMFFPSKKVKLFTQTGDRTKLSFSILFTIMLILIMGFSQKYLILQLNDKSYVSSFKPKPLQPSPPNSLPDNNNFQPTALELKNNALQKAIFAPGTKHLTILQALGEPLWRKPGFWTNSIAWSYENIVSEKIDIGYIFDRQTNILRQAEIAVPPTTKISTVQSAMNSFLATESSTVAIEQGLQAVYKREKNTYEFVTGNLEGIIQRNDQDRIYIAVWSAGFH
ncbi:serine/threonine protein kinase [Waterburya agarophytonicola K14]|uniref:Serine/threonine protein kinase n=1 Tax=Waterburya agarophytonicola KI4 TaxID=2874699 RepID=A0A964BWN5_9CYAN|nr:serine/threonine-protein kinase [Waterburya agarophytonicola]MCC0178895.1 serine/threonine protein kinase [Waterburya agarophytonicola KI4]